MANFTENYNLKKPLQEEFYNIDDHNGNMDIIDTELKKRASLDETGKVPSSQLPDMDYIPTSQKGTAGGVATLDENGKLKNEVFPEGVGGGSGKRTVRFTVGSSQYGWTSSDCDYLCDGTADDVEINAAIQALRTTGGEVVLLDGLYNLASKILIDKEGVTLSGNGANTKIIRAFNDDEYDDQQGLVVITNSFCTVRNLHFDSVNGTYTSNSVINLYNGNNCIIADNTIMNSSCDGIYTNGDYNTIDNNIITNCEGNGLYLYKGNKYVVTNNKVTGSGSYGIYVYNVKDSAISDNVSMDNTDSGIKVYWSDRTTFTGNVLNNNSQCGLYLTRGEGNIISGNALIANKHYGVHLNSMATDNVVMSNVYLDNTNGDVENVGTNNTIHLPDHTHDGADIVSGLDGLAGAIGATKIDTGTYTGTGTYVNKGSGHNSLTFPFVPKYVRIWNASSVDANIEDIVWNPDAPISAATGTYTRTFSLSGTTLTWGISLGSGSTTSAEQTNAKEWQCNESAKTYCYVAFG